MKNLNLKILYLFAPLAIWVFYPSLSVAAAVSQSFTFQGRLFNQAGTDPIEEPVEFQFLILNQSADCLLYREYQTVDLTTSSGSFAVSIGSNTGAAKRTATPSAYIDPGLTLAQIFKNENAITRTAGANCSADYTPVAGEHRLLRVIIKPQSSPSWETLTPDQTLNSVPYAFVAESLQGKGLDQFIIKDTSYITDTTIQQLFGSSGAPVDASLLHHHDGRYLRVGSSTSQEIGSGGFTSLGRASIGTNSAFDAQTTLSVQASSDSHVPIALRSFSGTQTADLFQVQNQSGTKLAAITASGGVESTSAKITSSSGNQLTIEHDSTNKQTIGVNATGTTTFTAAGSSPIFSFLGGSVGIGTTAPSHRLTISSTSPSFSVYNTVDQTTNFERFVGKWSGNTFLLGNEMGGTSPSRILRVGTAAVAGEINRTLNVSGATPFFSYTFSSTGLAGHAVDIGGGNTFVGNDVNQGALSITPTVSQTGTSGFRGLWVSPFLQTTGSGSNFLLDVGTNSAASGAGTHTSRFVVTTNGNVGVATTSPASTLSNTGTLIVDASNFSVMTQGFNWANNAGGFSAGIMNQASSANAHGLIVKGAGSSSTNTLFAVDRGASIGAPGTSLFRVMGNGNVGIGTTSPSAVLHSRVPTTSGTAFLGSDASGNGNAIRIRVSDGGVGVSGADIGADFLSTGSNTSLSFSTRASGAALAERMRITSSGNVGIGTSSPDAPLDIQATIGPLGSDKGLTVRRTSTQYVTLTELDGSRHLLSGYSTSANQKLMTIGSFVTGGAATAGQSDINFQIGQIGVAIITPLTLQANTGNVGIGTTTPAHKLDVNGDLNIASANALLIGGNSICTSSGCVTPSDMRLKKEITPLKNSLELISQINGVRYKFKDSQRFDKLHHVGLLAQEVEKVYPEAVKSDRKSGIKSIMYTQLIAPLIEAVKDLSKRIETLAEEVQSVRSQNQDYDFEMVTSKLTQLEERIRMLEKENKQLKQKLGNP